MGREEQIINERKRKLEELRGNKIDPYPYKYDVKNYSKEIKEKYMASDKIELFNKDLQSSRENLNNGLRYVYFSASIAAVFGIIISILMFPKFELLGILIRKKS